MTLQQGQTILNGKYHILRLIGEGGMARVWLAEEMTFGGRRVAIKEPRDDLLPDLAQEVRLRYQREVQVCAVLETARVPSIVRAITAEPYGETFLLAMEYMPRGDLATLLKQHPEGLSVQRAVGIALDLLAALEGVHAHEMEIVHRDVKPSNVLFSQEGKAHLADFGLAQLAGMSGRSQLAGGHHPGTPMYMAPEQEASPRSLTPAADLFALGCILFEMLTAKRYKRVRPGTHASDLQPEVPDWLDEVVARALIEDPWDRYADAAEMIESMRGGKEEFGSQGTATVTRSSSLRQSRSEAVEPASRAARMRDEESLAQRDTGQRTMPTWQRIGIEMVTIPEGEFLYGETRERIHLPEYAMAKTAVTNAQYMAFVEAMGQEIPKHWMNGKIPRGKRDHPVVNVSWHDAAAFCEWAGCRLPTEQEWEKGARGTDGRKYPWGDGWEEGRCNTDEAEICDTTPVGRYPNGASPYGLLDMAGNVWEWCEDWYDEARKHRVLRGGSWTYTQYVARSAFRVWDYPDYRSYYNGFRCVALPTSSL